MVVDATTGTLAVACISSITCGVTDAFSGRRIRDPISAVEQLGMLDVAKLEPVDMYTFICFVCQLVPGLSLPRGVKSKRWRKGRQQENSVHASLKVP